MGRVEKQRKKPTPEQHFSSPRYGDSRAHCRMSFRCVKYRGNHLAAERGRRKVEPAKCALCMSMSKPQHQRCHLSKASRCQQIKVPQCTSSGLRPREVTQSEKLRAESQGQMATEYFQMCIQCWELKNTRQNWRNITIKKKKKQHQRRDEEPRQWFLMIIPTDSGS